MHSIGSIISAYRKKAGLKQTQLAGLVNQSGFSISHKSISAWEKDVSQPSVAVFLELCRILRVPDLYEEYFGSNPGNPLSDLNESGKEKANDYIRLLKAAGGYTKQPDIIPFPARKRKRLYTVRVSAGTGNFLDDDNYEIIEVGNEVSEDADFGVRITGDSMEPLFINRQTVWVHRQPDLEDGEIGVFYLNDMSYCKKLRKNPSGTFLISLNPKYDPIPIREGDSFRIFGKVVQ